MLRFHTIVITPDAALKQAVRRVLTAVGSTAEFIETEAALPPGRSFQLLIHDTRDGRPSDGLRRSLPMDVRVLYLVGPGDLPEHLPLFVEEGTASLLAYDGQNDKIDDEELIATATKLLRRDDPTSQFGLQKYLPWGVTLFSAAVRNYEEKQRALDLLLEYAMAAGCRGPLRERLQAVADELMMNALYHAPVDPLGRRRNEGRTVREMAQLSAEEPILLQYGCSGRTFGVAVRDGYGSLQREHLLSYLYRLRAPAQSLPMDEKASGAGMGLVSVMRSATKLIFNLMPGHATEVIALFDRQLFANGQMGVRSLHLFSVQPPAAPPIPETVPPPSRLTPLVSPAGHASLPLLVSVSLLLLSLGALGGWYTTHHPLPVDLALDRVGTLSHYLGKLRPR